MPEFRRSLPNLHRLTVVRNDERERRSEGETPCCRSTANPRGFARKLDNTQHLFFPGKLLITPDGSIYVSNLGVSAGGGQVLLVPEPATVSVLAAGVAPLLLLRVRRRIRRPVVPK